MPIAASPNPCGDEHARHFLPARSQSHTRMPISRVRWDAEYEMTL
jgi:hypothetical protein